MKVSVIIPSRPDDPHLRNCLSVLFSAITAEMEVIVVADGWQPKGIGMGIKKQKFRIIPVEKQGPAGCRHHGALHARHEWLCFLDSDVLVHENTFVDAFSLLEENGDDGLVGSYDDTPTDPALVSRFRNLLHHYHHQQNAGMSGVFWGAFTIVRKSAYVEVGGFDPSFDAASVEDIDLGYRLSDKGFTVVLRPQVQVTHLKKWTLSNMIHTDIFLRAKPWTLLLNKYSRWGIGRLNTTRKEKLSAALSVSGALLGFLSITGILGWYPFFLTLLLFLMLQQDFYRFAFGHFRKTDMPFIICLHHLYYFSAITGWFLAKVELLFKNISMMRFNMRSAIKSLSATRSSK